MKERLKIIGITAIICIIGTFIITKLYFPNIKLQIINSHIGETQHQIPTNNIDVDNPADCMIAKNCANSDLKVVAETKGNKLYGKAFDDCKSIDFDYEFRATLSARHIIQGGYGFQYGIGSYGIIGYLYQFDFVAIGGNAIISKMNPGFNIIMQKAFIF
jgi:hypothetical protein